MKNTALILVDIQQGFNDPAWGQRNNPHFEDNVSSLLKTWRETLRPVFHIQHCSLDTHSPLHPLRPGHEFMAYAAPQENEVIIKKEVNSAFIRTDLHKRLSEARITDLVFAGFTSDHCVSTSVRMAANLGYACTIAADATSTFPRRDEHDQEIEAELVHRVSLASLRQEFSDVKNTSQII